LSTYALSSREYKGKEQCMYTLINRKNNGAFTHSSRKQRCKCANNGANVLPSTGKTRGNKGVFTHSSTVYTLINITTVHIHSHQQIHTHQQNKGA